MERPAARETSEGGARGAASRGFGKELVVGLVALAIVVLDQATKLWVVASLRLHESVPVIPGFFDLTYVRNTGAAFSLFAGRSAAFRVPFFVAVSVAAAVAIAVYVRRTPAEERSVLAGCAFVLGGALGNLIDRLLSGDVVDFLDLHWRGWHWPAFNVADSFITVGVALLVLRGLGGESRREGS